MSVLRKLRGKSQALKRSATCGLSICIPTYNRAPYVYVRIEALQELLQELGFTSYEIVVSNNHSSDATAEVMKAAATRSARLRVVSPLTHVHTAEENLAFALGECIGRYVWVLGDDDDPCPAGVEKLLSYVRADEADIVVFNSNSHSWDGNHIKNARIPCAVASWDGSLTEFVRRTGFWFVLAGFSTLLLRNPQQRLSKFHAAIAVSKIYSHVAWLIDAYHADQFSFCNTPLVSYRQNYTDVIATDHWPRVARREGTFVRGLWTNGYLRLVDALVESGAITRSFVATVVDRNLHTRFLFVDEVLHHFLEQLSYVANEHDPLFTPSEFDYFMRWAKTLYSSSSVLVYHLQTAADDFRQTESVSWQVLAKLRHLLADRRSRPWYEQFFVQRLGSYNLYSHGTAHWAMRVDAGAIAALTVDLLDIPAAPPFVLTASSASELELAVARFPTGVEPNGIALSVERAVPWLAPPPAASAHIAPPAAGTDEMHGSVDEALPFPNVDAGDSLGLREASRQWAAHARRKPLWLRLAADLTRPFRARVLRIDLAGQAPAPPPKGRAYRRLSVRLSDASAVPLYTMLDRLADSVSMLRREGRIRIDLGRHHGPSTMHEFAVVEALLSLGAFSITRRPGSRRVVSATKVLDYRSIFLAPRSRDALIVTLYRGILFRNPDAEGIRNYRKELASGVDEWTICKAFLLSPERLEHVRSAYPDQMAT